MNKKESVIHFIHGLFKNRKISCDELVKNYIKKINDSKLNAYVKICEQNAQKTAQIVDEKIKNNEEFSPLEGIPMVLKDNISTSGIETTCCSKILKGYVPIYDATAWTILKNQNSVLLGKANCDEFAMGSTNETSCYGSVLNPHDLGRVPGGSSGGCAAAVAGNIAVFGLGSDTGGSVRQPAAFCGIVGLKPTYGAVSRYGLIAYGSSLDQIGPMAPTVTDVSIIFDNIAGHDEKDGTTNVNFISNTQKHLKDDIKGLKIGIPREYFDGIDKDIKVAIENSIKLYQKNGAEVEYFDLPEIKHAVPAYYILVCAEASSNLARFDGIRYGSKIEFYKDINEMICKTRSEGFGREVQRRILLGAYVLSSGFREAYYKKAQKLREMIANAFDRAFEKYDVLITPVAPTTAFPLNFTGNDPIKIYAADICTCPINVAGNPAISVPCGCDSAGLPIGMQIVGKRFGEAKILNVAHQYEILTDFSNYKELETGVKL